MKELGEYLKAERLRQGVDLATITQQTCISKSMLTALEEGDSEQIETPLLVRSFARAYCRVLGLDPTPVLEKYTGETPRHERLDEGIRRYRERSLATRERARLKWFFLIFTLVTVAGVYITTVWLPKKEQAELLQVAQQTLDDTPSAPEVAPKAERSTPPTREQETKAATAPATATDARGKTGVADHTEPAAEATRQPGEVRATVPKENAPAGPVGGSAPAAQGYHLQVEATVETWVEVRLDDKKVEGVLLHAGESRDWDVQKGVRLLIGNAAGVKVVWNGKPLKNLGKAGKVVRLHLPEDAAKR
jgi:cytoskeleton protein RodZ